MSKPKYKWWGYVRNVCTDYHNMKHEGTNSPQDLKELHAVDAALSNMEDGNEREIVSRYLDGMKCETIAEEVGRTFGEVKGIVGDFLRAVAYEMGLYRPTLKTEKEPARKRGRSHQRSGNRHRVK